jgi:hypothetical protein
MSKGDWWFKFEFGKWRNDSSLRRCSLETKGFWIECLCAMREAGTSQLTGTYNEIARLVGCFPEEAARCVIELKRTETATVTLCNDEVTLKSRYMERELKAKQLTRLRVQKHRENEQCNAPVTVQSKNKSKSKKYVDNKVECVGDRPKPATAPAPIGQSSEIESVQLYFDTFPNQPLNNYQQDLIATLAEDLEAWRDTLHFWKANNHIARNVGNIIDRYKEIVEEKKNEQKQQQRLPSPAEKAAQLEEQRKQPKKSPVDFMRGLPATGQVN